jgi:hypothetical protein
MALARMAREAEAQIVGEIAVTVDRAADADGDRVVLDEQVLLEGSPEEGAMRDRRV